MQSQSHEHVCLFKVALQSYQVVWIILSRITANWFESYFGVGAFSVLLIGFFHRVLSIRFWGVHVCVSCSCSWILFSQVWPGCTVHSSLCRPTSMSFFLLFLKRKKNVIIPSCSYMRSDWSWEPILLVWLSEVCRKYVWAHISTISTLDVHNTRL